MIKHFTQTPFRSCCTACGCLVKGHKGRVSLCLECTDRHTKVARDIIDRTAARHGVTVDEILGRVRQRHVVAARQEATYRIRAETLLSLPQIGRLMHRDHVSVMHSIKAHAKKAYRI